MTPRARVIVTRRLPEPVERQLAAEFDVRLNATDVPSSPASLAEALREADGVVCTITDTLDAAVLATAPRRARILANFGVGHGHIDLGAARAAGVVVTNTPGVLTDDTADLTMTLLLATARRAGEGERMVRSGTWSGWRPTQLLGTRVTGKSLGIVGYGRIGRAVAARARLGFRMTVMTFDPMLPPAGEASPGVRQCASLEELLAASDFVSLHCPATPDTRHLIGAPQLARLRPHAILVNTARGDVIDEAALVDALGRQQLAAVGLDVYEHEPAVSPGLLATDRVVLLPHVGSATIETRTAMGMCVLANLRAFFAGHAPPDRVA
ncbi:MAG: D-glycerate dehydrogenase [Gemmatimonadetes bacterium]|nr:D-glycerate dehydrogenase [Gemmatimonadota bacterium]